MRFSFLLLGAFVVASVLAPRLVCAAGEALPIEVSADQSLEWHKDERLYLALGNAKAVRGATVVTADTLTAHERDPAAGGVGGEKGAGATKKAMGEDLDRLTAQGNVHIRDERQQVFGELAVYDLDRGLARVTGKNLKYIAGQDLVTAREALEYDEAGKKAVARGKAVAIREGRHVEGDVLTAHFGQNSSGQMDMTILTAEGHVTVITGPTVARGDHALYDVKKNIATLSGHVQITREGTQLAGDKAEVDFGSGQSRLLNTGASGRVKAMLGPQRKDGGGADAKENKSPATAERSLKTKASQP